MKNFLEKKRNNITVDSVNRMVENDLNGLISLSEQNYHLGLEEIARELVDSLGQYSIVLLAGPSASGKTTTAYKLREQLKTFGVGAHVVSLDDFYRERQYYPLREDGSIDYESVYALDLEELHACFDSLIEHGAAQFPMFDFETVSRRKERREVILSDRDILIVEGIHALNPLLTPKANSDRFFRIYASVKSQYVKNGKVILSPQDLRLIRRIVRDQKFRASSVENTFAMWDQVCEGEEKYIRPFRTLSDAWIDTIHLYEPCVFHHYFKPLAANCMLEGEHGTKLQQLIQGLDEIADISTDYIPSNSLLREFVGE